MMGLPFILVALAGAFNAAMDTLQFHFPVSVFKHRGGWWNPELSWMNKYKDRDKTQGPRFPGSTTFLIFLTDAWHLFQTISFTFFIVAIISYTPATEYLWLDFILYRLTFSITFEFFFKYIFMERKHGFFYAIGSWIKVHGVLASRLVLVISFFASFGVYKLLGGDGSYTWGRPETGAFITVATGFFLFLLTIWFVKKKPKHPPVPIEKKDDDRQDYYNEFG